MAACRNPLTLSNVGRHTVDCATLGACLAAHLRHVYLNNCSAQAHAILGGVYVLHTAGSRLASGGCMSRLGTRALNNLTFIDCATVVL